MLHITMGIAVSSCSAILWARQAGSCCQTNHHQHSITQRIFSEIEIIRRKSASKEDLKSTTGVDTSKFTKKVDLASLKSEINKLDIGKLKTAPVD